MILTTDSFVDSFPVTTLTKVTGLLTYEAIKITNDGISANAASVHTELDRGLLNFLAITFSPAICATVLRTPFEAPENPALPNLVNITGNQIDAANCIYNGGKRKFKEYVTLQNVLTKQMIASIDNIYLEAIKERFVGFGSRTVWELLDRLYRNYANILPADLTKNVEKINEPWDTNQPFEFVIHQV